MDGAQVRDAYSNRSAEYISLFGKIDAAAELDREHVLAWAQGIDGDIIDIGCGPGQWTSYLSERGVAVEGVDPVPEFIHHARGQHPGCTYRVGNADRLDVETASLGGVLAWFSLIHTIPDQIGNTLTEFARCVRPGGGLAIGFFESPELVPFDHAVTTAYSWPVGLLASRVEQAGFEVADVRTRTDPGTRPQGTLLAHRARDNRATDYAGWSSSEVASP